jgi:hypothetical protein
MDLGLLAWVYIQYHLRFILGLSYFTILVITFL